MTIEGKIKEEIKRLRKLIREAVKLSRAEIDEGDYYDAMETLRRVRTLEYAEWRMKEMLK